MTLGRRILLCAAGLGVGICPSIALADGPSDLEAALAEPVVSTASQSAEDQSTAPATTTTITAEDLHRYGIKTLAEAINFLSLGMITQNDLDDGEIGARGVLITGDYGDHVLLLVNGHAVNEQWDGTAYFGRGAGVPFELIDHIEVILGPGSVLYGSNAMLGVINVVTKRAKDFDGVHFVGEADLFTSGRLGIGAGHEFTLLGKRAELTFEADYYGQNGPAYKLGPQNYGIDPGTGKGECFNAACTNPGVWGGTPANMANNARVPEVYLSLIWGNFELDVRGEVFQRATPYAGYSGYNLGNQYEIDRFLSSDLRHRWAISSIAQLKSRLYGDLYDYREQLPTFAAEDCLAGQTNGCTYEGMGRSRWFGLEEQLSFDWLHDQSVTTLLGIDARYINVGEENDSLNTGLGSGPSAYTYPPPSGVFDEDELKLAVYGQQTWRPLKWLLLNGGARFDYDSRYDPRVSPRGVVAVNPWHNGTLKFIYSEAFRGPSFFETNFTDNESHIPNPTLKPETVRSGEVSVEQRFGSHRVFAGGFVAQYSDLTFDETAPNQALVAAARNGTLPAVSPNTTQNILGTYGVNGAQVSQFQNLSSVDNYGVNAAFEGTALDRDLRYGLNFTAAYTRQQIPNPDPTMACPGGTATATCSQPLNVTPEVFGNARISYDLPGVWPVLGVVASLVGPRPASGGGIGGWLPTPYAPTQVDLRGTVSGAFPGVPHLSYRFIVDYAVASVNPYIIGPVTTPTAQEPRPELVPVDQLRTTIGLQYDLR